MSNATIYATSDYDNFTPAVPCLVCGSTVELNERERSRLLIGHVPVKICKECKQAIKFAKQQMKNNE